MKFMLEKDMWRPSSLKGSHYMFIKCPKRYKLISFVVSLPLIIELIFHLARKHGFFTSNWEKLAGVVHTDTVLRIWKKAMCVGRLCYA